MKTLLKILKFSVQITVGIFLAICISIWLDAKKEEFKKEGTVQTKESVLKDLNEFITGPPKRTVYPHYNVELEVVNVNNYYDYMLQVIHACVPGVKNQTDLRRKLDEIVDMYLYMMPGDDVATDENIHAAKTWYDSELDKFMNLPLIKDC